VVGQRNESGAVTAETAAVLPVLVLLAAVLAWMVAYGVNQARAVDAARETARAIARGEDQATSTDLGRRIAPPGSVISVRDDEDTLVVTVRAEVRGPRGLLGFVPGHVIQAQAVAAREPVP
jgi:Flp pilus assembly protein TadG